MTYSFISLLALILNFIINRGILFRKSVLQSKNDDEKNTFFSYRLFLIATNCYFISDIGWGILYNYHEVDSIFYLLYIDCLLYFFFMFLTMLTWMRCVVTYMASKKRKSRFLYHSALFIFVLGIIYLLINYFYPFIFSFNNKHEYIMEPGRHIAFILQICLYFAALIYMIYIARLTSGAEKVRYLALGTTCLVMELFLVLQILEPLYPTYAAGLIISICVVHSFVEAGEKKEKEIYDHIASGLAKDYDAMYYIRIDTGEFREFVKSQRYEAMNVPVVGKDFYSETEVNVDKFVHPDDREFAKSIHKKDAMLKSLEGRKSFSYKYRLMIDGQSRFFLFTLMRAHDNKHFVLYEKDIEDEIVAENIRKETQKSYATFTQIAESLASNYDILYYVNIENSNYISYECKNIYGRLDMKYSGEDFFGDSILDIKKIVYKADRDMVLGYIDKDYIISSLSERKMTSIDYRIVAPDSVHYVRMTTHKTNDGIHYIFGIVNIDDEVKREREHLKALSNEKELARRDELTGVKNKTAYKELEKSVQENINKGLDYLPFGLVVCDANNLKLVNDTEGHNAGDEYIKQTAKVLCDIFAHSPVFRIGGDEFTVFLRGDDYTNRAELMKKLRSKILDNAKTGSGPILASGMSEYIPASDNLISDVFERADREMYEDKKRLKE